MSVTLMHRALKAIVADGALCERMRQGNPMVLELVETALRQRERELGRGGLVLFSE